jgi:hypothetical protein
MKSKAILPAVFYYEVSFDISLGGNNGNRRLDELFQFINLHHIGQKNPNKRLESGEIVSAITPEQEAPLRELHWRAGAGRLVKVKIGLDKHLNIVSFERI